MFNGTDAATLKADFREKFRNISRIMDCVGCDKCRLWGKLQVKSLFYRNECAKLIDLEFFVFQIQGLGTALKILFSGKFDADSDDAPLKVFKDPIHRRFKLKRGEIVSLFNAFGR